MGPVTWSLYVDTYYAWQFHQPVDHTIFPTTIAPRHNEISLNLAHVGVDVTGLDGPIGRLYLQYGSTVETIAGQDTTTTRGFFLTNRLAPVRAAGRGRLALSPVARRSTSRSESSRRTSASRATCPRRTGRTRTPSCPTRRPITSSASAVRSSRRAAQARAVGWSTAGRRSASGTRRARGATCGTGGPASGSRSSTRSTPGRRSRAIPGSLRFYSDNNLQVRYYHGEGASASSARSRSRSSATSATSTAATRRRARWAGVTLTHRFDWTERWKSTLRGDFFYDETQAISPKFPVGSRRTRGPPRARSSRAASRRRSTSGRARGS